MKEMIYKGIKVKYNWTSYNFKFKGKEHNFVAFSESIVFDMTEKEGEEFIVMKAKKEINLL